jgi:hypothetical protein
VVVVRPVTTPVVRGIRLNPPAPMPPNPQPAMSVTSRNARFSQVLPSRR